MPSFFREAQTTCCARTLTPAQALMEADSRPRVVSVAVGELSVAGVFGGRRGGSGRGIVDRTKSSAHAKSDRHRPRGLIPHLCQALPPRSKDRAVPSRPR